MNGSLNMVMSEQLGLLSTSCLSACVSFYGTEKPSICSKAGIWIVLLLLQNRAEATHHLTGYSYQLKLTKCWLPSSGWVCDCGWWQTRHTVPCCHGNKRMCMTAMQECCKGALATEQSPTAKHSPWWEGTGWRESKWGLSEAYCKELYLQRDWLGATGVSRNCFLWWALIVSSTFLQVTLP